MVHARTNENYSTARNGEKDLMLCHSCDTTHHKHWLEGQKQVSEAGSSKFAASVSMGSTTASAVTQGGAENAPHYL